MSWNKTNRFPVIIVGDENGRKIGAKGFEFWTKYQDKMYIEDYPSGFTGDQAIILGHTSNYLCCLDFDDHEQTGSNKFGAFKALISPSILGKMSIEETSNNGIHAYFRTELLEKKRVIARSIDGKNTIELLAGKGCITFCSYPDSKFYKQVSVKCIEEAEFLTDAEVFELIRVCESINEYIEHKTNINIASPVRKANGSITLLGDSGVGQADFLRGEEGRCWLSEILTRQGWTCIGERTSSDGRNYTAYSHPCASNPNKLSISWFEDTGVYCHSQDISKNRGLEAGTNYSIYQTILTIEFDGNTKDMSRAFYDRFPQFHNKLSYLGVDQLSLYETMCKEQEEEEIEDDDDDKNRGNTFVRKDELLRDIMSDGDYAILASHINHSAQNSAIKVPFGYFLSGLVLTGGCAYRNFVSRAHVNFADDINKPQYDVNISTILSAPSGSGKNNVISSFKCYSEMIDNFGRERVGSREQFETRIKQLPATQRGIQYAYYCGLKNPLFYQDEYQDILNINRGGDQQKQALCSYIKQLITKDDKLYEAEDSVTFNNVVRDIEKELGHPVDNTWWRITQFNVGTENIYSSLSQNDTEDGFARRYLWFNERGRSLVRFHPGQSSNHMTADPAFLDFLKSLLSVRDNGTDRLDHPVICIDWNTEADDAFWEYAQKNEEYVTEYKEGSSPLRNSYGSYVQKLACLFAIIRGEWINYDGDCAETIGDDVQFGIGLSSVGKREITVIKKDVDYAWRLFDISCYDYYYGDSRSIVVSNEERNINKFEKQIVSYLKDKGSCTIKTLMRKVGGNHSSKAWDSAINNLTKTSQIFTIEGSKRLFSEWAYKREIEKIQTEEQK